MISLDEFYSMVNRKHTNQEEEQVEQVESGEQEQEEQIAVTRN